MIGHGSPSRFAIALARSGLAICAMFVVAAQAQEVASPPKEPTRICVSWGGGDANPWVGQVRLEQGSLVDLKLLGSDPDAAGSIWLDSTGVQVHSLSAHKRDSFEVVANSDGDTSLAIQFAPRSNAAAVQAQVPLADVLRRPYLMRLDDRGNTLEIRAVASPTLHVTIKNDPGGNDALIFSPGSELLLELAATLPAPLHGTTLEVQTTLAPGRRKDGGSSFSQKLSVPVTGDAKTTLSVPLGVPEGVYTVHISVSRASGYLRDKFFAGTPAPIAEQSFQIVVMNSKPPAEASAGRWESVLEIDPTNPRWVERLPAWTQFRRIPGLYHGALGDVRVGAVNLTLGRFVELPCTSGGSEAHWQAYSLPLEATGAAHLLEIDYPADDEQNLGLNIVEPGASGTIEGVRLGSCVYVEGLGRVEEKQKQVQRVMFWPNTQVPLLVISNQHPQAVGHFGQIRVFKRIGPLNPSAASQAPQKRLIAAYVGKPSLVESGNSPAQDSSAGTVAINRIDDYEAAYEYATRLSGYVRFAGYNSAVVNVMGEGAATLPCAALTTPENYRGQTVDRCREADGLSIMLHVFDREGVTLIPAIDFATPISRLEGLRRANPQNSGVELVGPDGQTWLDTHGAQGGFAPYYNVLNPVVQQAMLDIVREITDRYGANSAFGGLAVQLNSNGYTQLPPLEWALDDSTMSRFSHDTGIQVPVTGADRFAARRAALTGANADAWRAWRSNQIADFYHRMAAVVAKNGNHKLILTTEKLFDHPVLREKVRPDLMADNRVAQTLLEMGVDFSLLSQLPGVVVCPTRFVGSAMPLPDRAIDLELNASFANVNRASKQNGEPSALLYHRSLPVRFANLDFGGAARVSGDTQFVTEFVPSGAAARQPYIKTLADDNPGVFVDGGDYLPPAQEDATRGLRMLISQLPTDARIDEIAKQPVIVRTYGEQNQSIFVVINTAPWHVDAQLTLAASAPSTLTTFPIVDGVKNDSENLSVGQQSKNVSLDPYSAKAFQVAAAGVTVVGVKASLDKPANDELKRRLEDLASRDLSAVHVYRGLLNPSFEPVGGGGAVPGWHLVGNSATASVSLDPLSPQEGRTSLHISWPKERVTGQSVAVESDPFPIPATGQLAMTVFARSAGAEPDAEIRLVFEAVSNGHPYRGVAKLKAAEADREKQQWRAFAILDSNLPLDSHGQMRVRFEFTGHGDFWLDNAKLNDLLWPLKFYPDSSAEIVKLLQQTHDVQAAYDAGQLDDCLQLLDRYWPRFIMSYTTTGTPAIALEAESSRPESNSSKPAPSADRGEPSSPGLSERIKHIVPVLR